MMLWLDTEHKT